MLVDRIGGMTVRELEARMDCDEEALWWAYMKKHDDPKGLKL